ncbi:MAG: hypothetical protein KME11_12545 [Timaviella obliquedivisa GSE-PSE-MK23-08B]|jgi:hypothetical protein|nr:hypothetical protein [Timaviella obliquedivisa GSE-PSE-MK23-08B]
MTTPESPLELLMQQPHEVRVNVLLNKYLMHHPGAPERLKALVQRAIVCSQLEAKTKVLCFVMTYG